MNTMHRGAVMANLGCHTHQWQGLDLYWSGRMCNVRAVTYLSTDWRRPFASPILLTLVDLEDHTVHYVRVEG